MTIVITNTAMNTAVKKHTKNETRDAEGKYRDPFGGTVELD